MRPRTIATLIGTSLGIAGALFVYAHAGWLAAVGVLLMLWGNNLCLSAYAREERDQGVKK